MIKGIHFDNSLRMVFTRGEGLIIGCIIFVVCLQVNGPTTGRAYYAPSLPPPPRPRLLLDQTEARRAEKKFLDTAPSPSFLTGSDNRPHYHNQKRKTFNFAHRRQRNDVCAVIWLRYGVCKSFVVNSFLSKKIVLLN